MRGTEAMSIKEGQSREGRRAVKEEERKVETEEY